MRVVLFDKIALVIGALLLVVGNGFIIYKNFNTEWRGYQAEYLERAIAVTDNPQMLAALENREPRIEQLIISDFGVQRVDRCTTCHTGIEDPRFADAPQPFTTHPKMPGNHPYEKFGCTTCHAGNGRGLAAADAHGEGKYWLEPLLKGDYIQAGCAKCHPAPYLDETPILREGADLFMTKACYACHKVDLVSDGKLGIELTEVGNKWHLEYLVESIVDPKANSIESIMPKFELSEDEVKALTIYLKSLTGENLVEGSVTHYSIAKEWKKPIINEVPITEIAGRQVFDSRGCSACHTINGVGGKVGPELSVVGLQRTKEWLSKHNQNPRSLIAGSIMPNFKFSASELEALSLYLSTLTKLSVDNKAIYGQDNRN